MTNDSNFAPAATGEPIGSEASFAANLSPVAAGDLFMKSKKSYSEKLRDPRWQKKRLEILSLDDFKCVVCKKEDEELHVHHLMYCKDREPWEYPSRHLICVCASCHDSLIVSMQAEAMSVLSSMLRQKDGKFAFDLFNSILIPDASKYAQPSELFRELYEQEIAMKNWQDGYNAAEDEREKASHVR